MGEGTDGQPTDGSPSTTQGTPRKKRTTPKKLVPRKMKKILEPVIFVTCVFDELVSYMSLYVVTETCVFLKLDEPALCVSET